MAADQPIVDGAAEHAPHQRAHDRELALPGQLLHLVPDGIAVVQTDMTDIGTGTYTILTQIAATNVKSRGPRSRAGLIA